MIFADRPSPKSGRSPISDQESPAVLIPEVAGPSSQTPWEAEAKAEGYRTRLHWQEDVLDKVQVSSNGPSPRGTARDAGGGNSKERVGSRELIKHYMRSQDSTPLRKVKGAADDDQRILLNVGGVRHETHVSTLKNVPGSRLSRLAELHQSSRRGRHEYFFDRHPAVFNSVIDFYRTGELHVPLEVCGAVVKRELDFWQIEELQIKACCWRHYRSYIENQRILNSFDRSLEHELMKIDLSNLKGWKLLQMKLWLIVDYPRTSKYAMVYGVTSFLFVAASIAGFCLETLPEFRTKIPQNSTNLPVCNADSNKALNVLDFICTVFFSLELIIRFLISPWKLKFLYNPMNIIDLLALVPLYVQVIFEQSGLQSCYTDERFVIEIMFILRIFRMFRIFHLVKHYQALKVLVYALRASLKELMMLFIFLLIATLIFATIIYYAERTAGVESGTKFTTIPTGFWWAIITMTTVGYGDVTPITPIGYIVGTACAVCGVLLLALTFPVISNNFTLFYEHNRSRSLSPRCRELGSFRRSVPVQVPDYGSTSVSAPSVPHNSSNKTAATAEKTSTTCGLDTLMKDKKSQKASYVPLARFSETSSMVDIIFQEPTGEQWPKSNDK